MSILFRYLAACVCATIVSFLLLFVLTSISGSLISAFPKSFHILGTLLPSLTFVIIGFCGAFIGSCCLPRSNRVFGAIALTVLGLLAGSVFWFIGISFVGFGSAGFTSLIFIEICLLVGALLNIWIQKVRNAAEQGAAANP